jgi:hypothetical protein
MIEMCVPKYSTKAAQVAQIKIGLTGNVPERSLRAILEIPRINAIADEHCSFVTSTQPPDINLSRSSAQTERSAREAVLTT